LHMWRKRSPMQRFEARRIQGRRKKANQAVASSPNHKSDLRGILVADLACREIKMIFGV
jgi:hypothetical protein